MSTHELIFVWSVGSFLFGVALVFIAYGYIARDLSRKNSRLKGKIRVLERTARQNAETRSQYLRTFEEMDKALHQPMPSQKLLDLFVRRFLANRKRFEFLADVSEGGDASQSMNFVAMPKQVWDEFLTKAKEDRCALNTAQAERDVERAARHVRDNNLEHLAGLLKEWGYGECDTDEEES